MKITNIRYPTPLSKIKNIEDDHTNVFVELEDGKIYTIVVSTPKNYYSYMDNVCADFYCGTPEIIVKSLTHENIENAMTKLAEGNAYWLKFYHLAGEIKIEKLDRIMNEMDSEAVDIFSF